MGVRLTTEEFIERARKVHGNLYNYSKVDYKRSDQKVCIIDPEYGEFWQTPETHWTGSGNRSRGYQKLSNMYQMSKKEFIKRAYQIHNGLYDYSNIAYDGLCKKILIIDPIYGKFWQLAGYHIKGHGNPQRAINNNANKKRDTTEQFIQKAQRIHDNLYDYSKANYINSQTKVCIIDPDYGEFWQRPNNHLNGYGCLLRAKEKLVELHKDHIIPLAIIGRKNKQRPLYKFLNSDINIQKISGGKNMSKSDWIEYKGKQIRAREIKNNYIIIADLVETMLHTNIDFIINEDKKFMRGTNNEYE